jgi:hypothetical protein
MRITSLSGMLDGAGTESPAPADTTTAHVYQADVH